MGPECLSSFVQSVPATGPRRVSVPRRGDVLSGVGFAAVLILSVFPWSRGAFAGLFGAWSRNWSLIAAVGALLGVVVATVAWSVNRRPALAAVGYLVLGTAVGAGAILHRANPPVLSEATPASGLVVAAGLVVLAGAALKFRDLVRTRRGRG